MYIDSPFTGIQIIKDLFYNVILKISQIYGRTSKETTGWFSANPWDREKSLYCVFMR